MKKDWRAILLKNKYQLFIADGLNEYYIATEAWARTDNFAEKMVEIDYHALKQHQYQSWHQDSKDLVQLHATIKNQEDLIEGQKRALESAQAQIEELSEHTLKDRPFKSRLSRSARGLTTDFYQYKKSKKPL